MYLIAVLAGFLIGGIAFVTRHPLGGALFGALVGYFIYRNVKLTSRLEDLEERLRLFDRTERPRPKYEATTRRHPPREEKTLPRDPTPPPPEKRDAIRPPADAPEAPRAAPPPLPSRPLSFPRSAEIPPAPAPAVAPPPAAPPRFDLPSLIRDYFTGGNVVVRVGIIVLFFGVAFLLKYTAERGLIPIELRLLGAAAAAIALLAVGWRLRSARRVYGLTLQGGGVGILYLTIFVAMKLYGLVPASAAFGLLVFLSVFSAALAILQDARFLAVFGATGGFLAPILTSTGAGNHVMLFSYYALLNGGIVLTAWHRSWRELNLLGFFFTFGIGGLWGAERYRPELFASTEPFLILFFLSYVAIAVLFSRNQPPQFKGYVDGTIIFGTPIVGFAYQAALVRSYEYGLAWTALAAGVFYMTLATLLLRRKNPHMKTLVEVFLAMGVIFATLAVPLAVDGRWTSAAWALEGAGILWVSVRQKRALARGFSLLLQAFGGIAFLIDLGAPAAETPVLNSICLGGILVAGAGFFSAWILFRQREVFKTARAESSLMLAWGLLWWLGTGIREIERYVDPHFLPASVLAFVAFSAAASFFAARRLDWEELGRMYLGLLPAMIAGWVYVVLGEGLDSRPSLDGGWIAWPLAFAVHYLLLRKDEAKAPAVFHRYFHIGLFLLLLVLATWEAVWWTDSWLGSVGAWVIIAGAAVPALFVEIVRRLRDAALWPISAHRRAYLLESSLPPVLFLLAGSVVTNLLSQGNPRPLPYVPLLNPFDITQIIVFLALASWVHVIVWQESLLPVRDRAPQLYGLGGATVFLWLNAVLIRTLHYWGGVTFSFRAMSSSDLVQTSLSIFWALTALVVMVAGTRRKLRVLWMTGAGLLGVVVLKLFTVDLSNVSTIERIISFLVVGALCLLIGYLAPLPLRGPSAESGNTE